MVNIILCGGSGTRLWPLSRTLMPKQFVKLFDQRSLFQLTLERHAFAHRHLIVSNKEQYFLALDQQDEVAMNSDKADYLLEPIGRNTAPSIALACLAVDPDEIVFVTPSDHLIKDQSAYLNAVEKAKRLASQNTLVTFGISPSYPETGYGYLQASGNDVLSFKEKPDVVTAQSYIDSGNYYWNSGIFMFKAGVFLEELKKHAPDIHEACVAAMHTKKQDAFIRIDSEAMLRIPERSIDYAVMEHSTKVQVVPSDMHWSDMGSFEALAGEVDGVDHIAIDSTNNLVLSDKQVATINCDDLVIIDTLDALLISRKDSTQKVKQVVEELKSNNSELAKLHTLVHRPWGTYEVLRYSKNYKIKQIVVNPGKRLSLQKHLHRSEHWVVVSGTAVVTLGNEEQLLATNESTYIKIGEVHRLENKGKIPLVLIEVQVGAYTGEDDIIRIEDDFKRTENTQIE